MVAAGLGYWLLTPSENMTYTTPQTSLFTSQQARTTQQTSLPTSSTQTSQSSISSTTFTSGSATTLWINITATEPVSYYISLLKSAGAQPYVELGWELQALPDATNATAVAKITYLALNATNPEVKEAFELMIKGGTPDSRDFSYSVPSFNTELQVLYWLALQNEFKKDDTLALAVAMVNGLWMTMGEKQVREAVKNDTSALLRFFRETNELQKNRGYYQLEGYPLESKVSLVWTGTMSPTAGQYPLANLRDKRLDLKAYNWNTVSIATLSEMQRFVDKSGWFGKNVNSDVKGIEEYLWFSGFQRHWNYTCFEGEERSVAIDGEAANTCGIFNLDWQFKHFLEKGIFIGGCADESSVVNAFLMSIGVASSIASVRWGETGFTGHFYVTYYDPSAGTWRIYGEQLRVGDDGSGRATVFYVFVPPVRQGGYILWDMSIEDGLSIWKSRAWHTLFPISMAELYVMFSAGVPTSEVGKWLLYS